MEYKDWVIDVTHYTGKDIFCFVPVENPDSESPAFRPRLNYLASLEGFSKGRLRGVIHESGEKAVEAWIEENKDVYRRIAVRGLELLNMFGTR